MFLFPLELGSLLVIGKEEGRGILGVVLRDRNPGEGWAMSSLTGLWGQFWSRVGKTKEPKAGKLDSENGFCLRPAGQMQVGCGPWARVPYWGGDIRGKGHIVSLTGVSEGDGEAARDQGKDLPWGNTRPGAPGAVLQLLGQLGP